MAVVTNDFQAIFTHSPSNDCAFDGCSFKAPGCVNAPPAQSNVVLGSGPLYGITAVENLPEGWPLPSPPTLTLCFECLI